MHRPYQKILVIVTGVWVFGTVAATAWATSVAPEPLLGLDAGDVGMISVASGIIALLAILPGCGVAVPPDQNSTVAKQSEAFGQTGESDRGAEPASRGELSQPTIVERLGNAFLVGMMIRLAGTVALFLASSYYLDASLLDPNSLSESDTEASLTGTSHAANATQIAVWVLGWHLMLLLTEVVALAREIQRIHSTDSSC